jgi:8-amino-7-oxononanoate synthase
MTEPSRISSSRNGTKPARPETFIDDPFFGFFDDGPREPRANGLVDVLGARRWFAVVGWGIRSDLYLYQQPLSGRSGPRVPLNGRPMLVLSSYDYLGLVGHPVIEAAAIEAVRTFGTGTGGVRLLTGTTDLHRGLEHDLAGLLGTERAITFSSGYAANVGTIASLFGPRDLVIADSRIHRSLLDGCAMARVPVRTFHHNDMDSLRETLAAPKRPRRTLIAVEGIYSMDGDVCPLPDIVALKQEFDAFLLVDEAHSLGVLGARGGGAVEHFGIPGDAIDLRTGSLSKAVPSMGGFVGGSQELIAYLQHGVSSFMFSAALCPAAAAAARAALGLIEAASDRRAAAWRNAERLRGGLTARGYDVGRGGTPLIPVIAGEDESAYRLARALWDRGMWTTAVVYPAVPRGLARLRLCATAAHSEHDIDTALEAFGKERAVRPAPRAVPVG